MDALTDFTESKREKFLETISASGNISLAAQAAGVSRRTPYYHRDKDPDFAQAWEDAFDEFLDHAEKEAWRRATEGVEEPIGFDKGVHQGMFVKRYSDTLLMFMLKGHRAEKFRENLNLSGGVDTGESALAGLSLKALRQIEKIIDEDDNDDQTK
jgi:hypothetical protein